MTLKDEWFFSYVNRVAAATLDGGEEIIGFEPENVTDYREYNVWRVAGETMTLKGELASPLSMQCVLFRTRPGEAWEESDEAILSLSDVDVDSDEIGSWTIPLDADPFTGCVTYLNETEVSARYFSLTLPAKDLEYVHIGPLFLPRNFSKGPEVGTENTGIVERSLFTSSKTIQPGVETDTFSGQFEAWSYAEFQAWRSFERTVGKTNPFVFGASQTLQLSESYLAHLMSSITYRPIDNRWLGQIQLEALR